VFVEMAGARRLRETSSGTKWPPRAPSPINCMNVSIELPLAASAFASDSVEGQPLAAIRRDALGFVEGGRVEAGAPG